MAELEINKTGDLNPNTPEGQQQIVDTVKELLKDPSINKPSREECDQFKAEYEEAHQEFVTKRIEVGQIEEGNNIMEFLNHFSRNRFLWKGTEWMGVIKLKEELEYIKLNFVDQNKPFSLGYQASEFIFHMLQNPGGIGLEAAEDFEQDAKLYAKIFDQIAEVVRKFREIIKDVEFAQQKWMAAEQGFYLEREDGIVKEEDENGVYFDEELGRDVVPGEPEYKIEKFQKMMQQKYGEKEKNK